MSADYRSPQHIKQWHVVHYRACVKTTDRRIRFQSFLSAQHRAAAMIAPYLLRMSVSLSNCSSPRTESPVFSVKLLKTETLSVISKRTWTTEDMCASGHGQKVYSFKYGWQHSQSEDDSNTTLSLAGDEEGKCYTATSIPHYRTTTRAERAENQLEAGEVVTVASTPKEIWHF